MIRSLGFAALGAAFALPVATAQDIQGPFFKPLAFHVQKSDGGGAKNLQGDRESGTRVVARLEVPGRTIVALDTKNSTLDNFTDDKKTDLLPAPAAGALPNRLALPIAVHTDGLDSKPGDVAFHGPVCPAKGATKVHLKGTVVVLLGKEEKEVEKKDVVLKDGAELGFGNLKAPTNSLGLSTTLTYVGEKPIKSVTLIDADGKEISCRTLRNSTNLLAKTPYRASILANGKVEKCTVRIKYFDAVEELKVPVDLEVGPGL